MSLMNEMQKNNPEFLSEVVSLNKEQLESRIAQLCKDASEVEKAKEADEELQTLKDSVKTASEPYRDAKKAIKQKVAIILELLEGQGK